MKTQNREEIIEVRILITLRKLEKKFGRLIPIELLNKEIGSTISLGESRKIIKKLLNRGEVDLRLGKYISTIKKTNITNDLIEASYCDCVIKHKGTNGQQSRIFCDRIEYLHHKGKNDLFGDIFDHHLMFWKNDDLVFKIWLPNENNDKEFKDIFEALESCGIKCLVRDKNEN